jgi:hypothetical protein
MVTNLFMENYTTVILFYTFTFHAVRHPTSRRKILKKKNVHCIHSELHLYLQNKTEQHKKIQMPRTPKQLFVALLSYFFTYFLMYNFKFTECKNIFCFEPIALGVQIYTLQIIVFIHILIPSIILGNKF